MILDIKINDSEIAEAIRDKVKQIDVEGVLMRELATICRFELTDFQCKMIELNQKIMNLMSNWHSNTNNIGFEFHEVAHYQKQNAEQLAIDYFKNMGFKVDKMSHVRSYYPHTGLGINWDDFIRTGMPDLLVYDEHRKVFFFVEVKTNGDGIRPEQIQWARKYPSVQVIYMFIKQKIIKEHIKHKKELIAENNEGLKNEGIVP